MELQELKTTLEEVDTLIKKAQDLAEEDVPQSEKDAILNMLEATKTSLERALKDVEQIENKEELVEVGVAELLEQMGSNSLYKNLTKETKGLMIHKIMNHTKFKVLSEKEFREYVAGQLALLSTNELVQKAYSKEDIIRSGENVARDSNEQVKYEEGLNFLTEMSDTPSAFQDLLALAFKNTLSNNDELLRYLKNYYELV